MQLVLHILNMARESISIWSLHGIFQYKYRQMGNQEEKKSDFKLSI